MVNDPVFERERAHARPLAHICRRVGSAHGREGSSSLARTFPWSFALIVVFDAALPLLFLGVPDAEIRIEIAAEGRRPRNSPAHSMLVRLKLRERRTRHRPEHHVMVGEMHPYAVEPVRNGRAGRTTRGVIGTEHEMVNEQLRTTAKKVCQRGAPFFSLEFILLVDSHPGQLLTFSRQ